MPLPIARPIPEVRISYRRSLMLQWLSQRQVTVIFSCFLLALLLHGHFRTALFLLWCQQPAMIDMAPLRKAIGYDFLWDQRSKRGCGRSHSSPSGSSTRLSSVEVFHLGNYGIHTLVGVTKLFRYDMLDHMLSLCQSVGFLVSSPEEGYHKCGAVLNSPLQPLTCILLAAGRD